MEIPKKPASVDKYLAWDVILYVLLQTLYLFLIQTDVIILHYALLDISLGSIAELVIWRICCGHLNASDWNLDAQLFFYQETSYEMELYNTLCLPPRDVLNKRYRAKSDRMAISNLPYMELVCDNSLA